MPQQFDYGSRVHVYIGPSKDKYCRAYFEVLELFLASECDIGMFKTIESLLLNASNGKLLQISNDINFLFEERH